MLRKILITAEYYHPVCGGIEQYLRGLASFLRAHDIHVDILCQSPTDRPEEEAFPEAHVHRTPLLTGSMTQPFAVIKNKQDIASFIRRGHYDVVYANNHNSLAVILASKIVGIPVIYGCHGAGLICPLKKRLLRGGERICWEGMGWRACTTCGFENGFSIAHNLAASPLTLLRTWRNIHAYSKAARILDSADARFCNSSLTANLFRKNQNTYGIPLPLDFKEGSEYGYYPVDCAPVCRELSIEPRGYVLLPGRVHNVKGHHHAIEAMRLLPKELKLVCVGGGGEPESTSAYAQGLRRQVEERGLQSRVIITGQRALPDMRQLYSGAAVTLVPSVWLETFGYVVIESLGCATPVILTETCGAKECVDATYARVIPPKDPAAIAAAVEEVWPRAKAMGGLGRKSMLANHDWSVAGPRILDIFDCILQQAPVKNT